MTLENLQHNGRMFRAISLAVTAFGLLLVSSDASCCREQTLANGS